MEELAKLEAERGTPGYVSADGTAKGGVETVDGKKGKQGRIASNEMCIFLILNISSLQLIPVNMIAYRQQYGSVNPAGIIAPAIVATAVSTSVAVVYCKAKDRRRSTEEILCLSTVIYKSFWRNMRSRSGIFRIIWKRTRKSRA